MGETTSEVRRGAEFRRRVAALGEWRGLAALAAILIITGLHYATAIHHAPYHDLFRRLYYVPVIYAAVRYGLVGGAGLSAAAALMYLPHLLSLLATYPGRRVDNVADVVLLLLVGVLTGALVDTLGRKERLATIGSHASHLVHDVHAPMTAISLSARLIGQPYVDEPLRREMAALIRDTADRLADMSAEVSQYACGNDSLQLEHCSLNHLVRDTATLYQQNLKAAGVELALELEDDVVLRIDRNRLRRALLNLVQNAKQAMPEGGRLTVVTTQATRRALIQVRDSGPGIPDEIADTLFQPFVTHGQRKRTGLGLAIAREIVTAHGGELTVESPPGHGATFTIALPLGAGWATARLANTTTPRRGLAPAGSSEHGDR